MGGVQEIVSSRVDARGPDTILNKPLNRLARRAWYPVLIAGSGRRGPCASRGFRIRRLGGMTTPQGDGATHRPDLFGLVTREIGALCIDGLDERRIDEDSLLIDDLGLDSLKFVDLTLRLEEALGVEEFPMQD